MNLERAAMLGHKAKAESERDQLKSLLEGLASKMRQDLNTALTPLEDMRPWEIAAMMDEFILSWGKLAAKLAEVDRLKRELGE